MQLGQILSGHACQQSVENVIVPLSFQLWRVSGGGRGGGEEREGMRERGEEREGRARGGGWRHNMSIANQQSLAPTFTDTAFEYDLHPSDQRLV